MLSEAEEMRSRAFEGVALSAVIPCYRNKLQGFPFARRVTRLLISHPHAFFRILAVMHGAVLQCKWFGFIGNEGRDDSTYIYAVDDVVF